MRVLNKKVKSRNKLINIIGIDGAGKTTLAKRLALELAKTDPKISYAYAQYFAKLLWPFKKVARLFFMTNTDEFREYTRYNKKKQGASRSHPKLSMVYAGLWLADYIFQIFFKVTMKLAIGRRLVLDRYIFDIAVNLSLTLGRNKDFSVTLAGLLLKFCVRPDRVILIDLPEAVAWGRKGDIQDPYYLSERRERYLYLAQLFDFTVIDGTLSKDEVLDLAIASLAEENYIPETEGQGPDHRKTILYVHANNDDVGGADYCLFKLAAALDPTRFRPVVCLSGKTPVTDLYEKQGIRVRIIPMKRIQKRLNPFYLAGLLFGFYGTIARLRQIIREEKVDLVHGNDLLDIYGPLAARLEKIPATQYVRWIMVSPVWLKRLITGLVYRLNHRVMTVSRAVAREMFSKDGKVLPGVSVCYDWLDMDAVGHGGRDTDIRYELGLDPDTPLVGCVGRLEEWKGQDLFIRAAAMVAKIHPNARFLVVGGEVQGRGRKDFGERCRSLAWALNLGNRVIFTGHRKDMGAVMENLDILVHASRTPDPLPGVVMEGMAAGIPVVGSDAGGVPEEMKDRETGLLYEPGNIDDMAARITWLLDHPYQAREMGWKGQKHVTIAFHKAIHYRKIENLYLNMMSLNMVANAGIIKLSILNSFNRAGHLRISGAASAKGDSHVKHI